MEYTDSILALEQHLLSVDICTLCLFATWFLYDVVQDHRKSRQSIATEPPATSGRLSREAWL